MTDNEAIAIAGKTKYTNSEISYLKNVTITEWDIKSAGLSVIKFRGLLPEDEIHSLENMDKKMRTVKEGLLQRSNPELAKAIIKTLKQAVQGFVILNSVPSHAILSIKKDAIFLINSPVKHPIIKDAFEFRKKNTYTSYVLLGNNEFYYNSLSDKLDIKGISDENCEKQKNFLLKDIRGFLKSAESVDRTTLFEILKRYRSKYLNRELPIETYRELETGCFRLGSYLIADPSKELLDSIDISQNYMNFIVPLIEALL